MANPNLRPSLHTVSEADLNIALGQIGSEINRQSLRSSLTRGGLMTNPQTNITDKIEKWRIEREAELRTARRA
jgi:hypothetical protein